MQKNNTLYFVFALLIIGFIIGWFSKPIGKQYGSGTIKIHDTLKTTSVQYKIIPGSDYNIDSLVTVINQFWKDSLKNMYGKGLFESKFSKTDNLSKRDYTLTSRIPLDPESQLIVDESFVFPKRTFGLVGSIGSSASLGLKYYMLDTRKLCMTGFVLEGYVFNNRCCKSSIGIECEYKF